MTLASTPERLRQLRSAGSSAATDARSKTVLFCECGREASPRAWRTERDGRRRLLVCPDCDATLTVR
jgi:hypothetical protein